MQFIRFVLITLSLILTSGTQADVVSASGATWGIELDIKGLQKQKEAGDIYNKYSYYGRGERFNVSFFVGQPLIDRMVTTDSDVHLTYWARAARNKYIDSSTIKHSRHDDYMRVEYFYQGTMQGKSLDNMKHVNYFAEYMGRWIDVHISVNNPTPEDEQAILQLEENFKFVPVN